MEFSSTWQRHKAQQCLKTCWYCSAQVAPRKDASAEIGLLKKLFTGSSRFDRFKEKLGKLLRSTRGKR